MKHVTKLRRSARLGIYGALFSVIALGAVACSDDDDETGSDDAETTASADADTGTDASASDAEASSDEDDALTVADDRGYAEGHRLLTGEWLAGHLGDEGLVVVDLRPADEYAAGHVPGAINIDPATAFSATDATGVAGQIAPADAVAAALAAAGVSETDTVVFYDTGHSLWASRSLWVLDVYGHAASRVLDGGFAAWSADEREISTEARAVTATTYAFTAEPNDRIIANLDEITAAIDNPEALVCDARSAEEYSGRDARSAQGGHVPGAYNEEWNQALDDGSRFRAADELRAIYEDTLLKDGEDAAVYVYCQTGVRAAHTWFVLNDLIGLDHVENYDGSWEEYGNRTDVDVERS